VVAAPVPGLVSGAATAPLQIGVDMKYLIVFFGLLLAYSLIYAGVSKFTTGLTFTEGKSSSGEQLV
jgi:uncharacterized membrane protein YphA (DoxX/SURF4 family)